MKRMPALAMTCLALMLIMAIPAKGQDLTLPSEVAPQGVVRSRVSNNPITASVLSTLIPEPVQGLQAHWLFQNSYVTSPTGDPNNPDASNNMPDVTFRLDWSLPESSPEATIVIGVFPAPFAWAEPGVPINLPMFKRWHLTGPTTSIIMTATPSRVLGYDNLWNITAWRVVDGVASDEVTLHDALITSAPVGVFRPQLASTLATWDNYNPVRWDPDTGTWLNVGTSGQGGPEGELKLQYSIDGALASTATVSGEATSWVPPAMPAGHNYRLSIARHFQDKVSPTVNADYQPWASTKTTLKSPASAKRKHSFTVSGLVTPGFAGKVSVKIYKKVSGRYHFVTTKTATYADGTWHIHTAPSIRTVYRFQATFNTVVGRPVHHSHSGYDYTSVK